MVADSSTAPQTRVLLVGADAATLEATTTAARHAGAWLEVMPTLESGLAWLLHPAPTSTHVLVPADLPRAGIRAADNGAPDIDALAGMVDEVTDGRARLVLLGPDPHGHPPVGDGESILAIPTRDAPAIEHMLRSHPPAGPPARPRLSAAQLRDTLHDGRLRVRLQPVVDARSLRLIGVEALSRLHHPSLGILRPSQFIGPAIETGQERAMSAMAAARAVMDLRGQAFMQSRYIAFNVPLATFLHQAGPTRALEICAIAAHPADHVVIELVETPTSPDLPAVAYAAEAWRRAGFNIVIDDAGPRLPHWRGLLALPFHGVKLDGSLAHPGEHAMRQAEDIVTEARRHGKYVVAEGIETKEAADRMRALGVDAMQGYFFCRPLPVPALRLWSQAWNSLLGARPAA